MTPHFEATAIIGAIEGRPEFMPLVEVMVLAPYRAWASGASDVEQLMDGPAVLERLSRKAAKDCIAKFVRINVEFGQAWLDARGGLIDALAAKFEAAARASIEAHAPM